MQSCNNMCDKILSCYFSMKYKPINPQFFPYLFFTYRIVLESLLNPEQDHLFGSGSGSKRKVNLFHFAN